MGTLDWLSDQSWFDGRLGMWGGSYFGYTQWVIADQSDPRPYRAWHPMQVLTSTLCSIMVEHSPSGLHWVLTSTHEEDVEYDREKLFMGVDGFPLMEADDRAGVAGSYLDDWVSHPTADFYWNRSNTRERITRMNGPVHLLAGWFDPFLPSQLKDCIYN